MLGKRTLEILATLAKKNDDGWFEAHAEEYRVYVKEPFVALVDRLGAELGSQHRRFRFSARSVSRLKSREGSYKEQISCVMGPPRPSRFEHPVCFYLSLGRDHNLIAAGVWMPNSRQLRLIRDAIQRDPAGLLKILKQAKLKRHFPDGLGEPDMVRGPKGYPVDPKHHHLLMHKHFALARHFTAADVAKRSFADEVVKAAEAASPYVRWLEQAGC